MTLTHAERAVANHLAGDILAGKVIGNEKGGLGHG